MSPLLAAILASTFVSLLTIPLGFLFLRKSVFRDFMEKNFVALCAGIMLGTALINLLPESLAFGQNPKLLSASALLGIIIFFLLEKSTIWFHHHDGDHGEEPATKLILIGDGLHNFIDGIAIALSFMVSTQLGLATTLAITLHEIPSEISDLSILINKGMKVKKAIWFNFLSALTSIAGTIFGFLFVSQNPYIQGPLLAMTAGMFIYIACSDLIPDLHNESHEKNVLSTISIFLIGVAVTVLIGFWE